MNQTFFRNAVYHVVDDRDKVQAIIFTACPAVQPKVIRAEHAREVIEGLRSVPRFMIHVDIMYPQISPAVHSLNERKIPMDIEKVVAEREDREARTEQKDLKKFFVAPAPDTLPDDGIMQYQVVESVYDVKDIPERTVLLFKPEAFEVLNVLTTNSPIFSIELTVLVGIPGADYSPYFDQNVWSLERSAYVPLINDLRVSAESEAILRASNATLHDKERGVVQRADGSVKEFTKFVAPNGESAAAVRNGELDDVANEDFKL